MQAKEEQLRKLLRTDNRYQIPLWQRQYSWGKHQWESLWEDIVKTADNASNETGVMSHFFGALILSENVQQKKHVNDPTEVIVIDGQQRLTTSMIVLAAIRDVLDQDGDIDFSGYLLNSDTKNGKHYKLVPQTDDQEMFFKILDAAQISAESEALEIDEEAFSDESVDIDDAEEAADPYYELLKERSVDDLISKAYLYFRKKIEIRKLDNGSLQELVSALMSFDVVTITLHSQDSWQKIFETVNALGVDLQDSDLVRNYLFMQISDEKQLAIYDAIWKPMEDRLSTHLTDFLLSFSISRGFSGSRQKKTIYKAFRYEISKPTGNSADAEKTIRILHTESSEYIKLIKNDSRDCIGTDIDSRLEFLAQWGAVPMHPLLLKLLRDLPDRQADLDSCLKMLQSFVVRRFLAGVPPNDLRPLFSTIVRKLQGVSPNLLKAKLFEELCSNTARWANDEILAKSISSLGVYSQASSNRVFLTLKALAVSYEKKSTGFPTDVKQGAAVGMYQVEHILPQSPINWKQDLESWGIENFEEFCSNSINTLPNLTLTKFNPNMSNNRFADKKEWLASENIVMTRSIAVNEKWSKEELELRSKELLVKIQIRFPGPSYEWLVN